MRRVKTIIGYAIVIGLFAAFLALELTCIAMAIIPVVGIVTFVRLPISPGDILMSLWRIVMIALFGAMAGLSAVLVVLLPYKCVTAWMSAARQPPSQAA